MDYKEGRAPGDGKMGSAIFVYGATHDFEYAESFLNFYYSYLGENRLSIQISKNAKYVEYLSGVKKFAPTPINSKIVDGDLVKIHKGATTTFEFTIGTASNRFGNTKSSWSLFIVENEDYGDQFGYY